MSRRGVASDKCSFCLLRPYRHDLCPRTIVHNGGQQWVCKCADVSHAPAQTAPAGKKKRRMVKV